MQINLSRIQYHFIKYAPYLLAVVVFLYFTQCGGNKEAEFASERKNLKKENVILEQQAKRYLAEAKRLERIETKYKDTVALLDKRNIEKQLEIIILNKQKEVLRTKVAMYNTTEIANWYKKRYQTSEIKTVESGTVLPDATAKKSIVELITLDSTQQELKITQEIVANKDSIIVQKDSLNAIGKEQNVNLQLAIGEKDSIILNNNAMVKSVEKSLRRQKVKTTLWKGIAGAILTAAGYIIITK